MESDRPRAALKLAFPTGDSNTVQGFRAHGQAKLVPVGFTGVGWTPEAIGLPYPLWGISRDTPSLNREGRGLAILGVAEGTHPLLPGATVTCI